MLNSLSGKVSYKGKERIFVQSGDIEWDLLVSTKSLDKLPAEGERVRVFVYLHHREDQLKLYGFATMAERELFLDLLKVEGLGPRLALKVLSGIEVEDLITALDNDDLDQLISIPGLGRKTAQKIILKLKGKLTTLPENGMDLEGDIISALAGMGFDRRLAGRAVKACRKELHGEASSLTPEQLERELFKRALVIINRERSG
jgi:Holliday junction DNA helicase RuvA